MTRNRAMLLIVNGASFMSFLGLLMRLLGTTDGMLILFYRLITLAGMVGLVACRRQSPAAFEFFDAFRSDATSGGRWAPSRIAPMPADAIERRCCNGEGSGGERGDGGGERQHPPPVEPAPALGAVRRSLPALLQVSHDLGARGRHPLLRRGRTRSGAVEHRCVLA